MTTMTQQASSRTVRSRVRRGVTTALLFWLGGALLYLPLTAWLFGGDPVFALLVTLVWPITPNVYSYGLGVTGGVLAVGLAAWRSGWFA